MEEKLGRTKGVSPLSCVQLGKTPTSKLNMSTNREILLSFICKAAFLTHLVSHAL
jgi:hypothetical protein